MKKFLFTVLTLIFLIEFSYSQVSCDPTDDFYKYAQNWELKGYISSLPVIRPYPSSVIKNILQTVIDNGDKKDKHLALSEYERIFSKPYSLYLNGGADLKASISETDSDNNSFTKNFLGQVGIKGEIIFHPLVSFGYDIGFYGESANFFDVAPLYLNKGVDSYWDAASVGPIDFYNDWNTNIAFGKDNVYVMGGISKTGFGPFLSDGLALNDSTFHSANIIFNVEKNKLSYGSSFEIIGATTNNPTDYASLADGKYLSFHSVKYRFSPKFSLSYYENIIFGPRTNLAYLLPAPFMAIQNIGGANDNLQMGLLAEFVPISGLKIAADIFVDDISVNEVVKLNFDSRIRLAGQFGTVYAPSNSLCDKIQLNYQIVLPYVYAHWDYESDDFAELNGSTMNYQNYTNAGVKIGSVLDPNSDKVSFKIDFTNVKNVKFSFATNIIRHANSAEAMSENDIINYVLADKGNYLTDGSVFMHQVFSAPESSIGTHVEQAWDSLGFMTSDHKMQIVQDTLKVEFSLPKTKAGQFTLFAGYTFEYITNYGVSRNIFTGGTIDWEKQDDGTYKVGEATLTEEELYQKALERAYEQKQEWIDSLENKINHYFSVGFKYIY